MYNIWGCSSPCTTVKEKQVGKPNEIARIFAFPRGQNMKK